MTIDATCIPCQHGHHDRHLDVVERGIPGMIGSGWTCPCRGECVEAARKRDTAAVAERMVEVDVAQIMAVEAGKIDLVDVQRQDQMNLAESLLRDLRP